MVYNIILERNNNSATKGKRDRPRKVLKAEISEETAVNANIESSEDEKYLKRQKNSAQKVKQIINSPKSAEYNKGQTKKVVAITPIETGKIKSPYTPKKQTPLRSEIFIAEDEVEKTSDDNRTVSSNNSHQNEPENQEDPGPSHSFTEAFDVNSHEITGPGYQEEYHEVGNQERESESEGEERYFQSKTATVFDESGIPDNENNKGEDGEKPILKNKKARGNKKLKTSTNTMYKTEPELHLVREKVIVNPTDNGEEGARRSRRTRVEPLAFWRNEKAVYNRRESGIHLAEVIRATQTENDQRLKKANKSKKVSKEKENNEIPPEIPIINYETKKEEFQSIVLISYFRNCCYARYVASSKHQFWTIQIPESL